MAPAIPPLPLFESSDAAAAAAVVEGMHRRRVPAGEPLMAQGEPSATFALVVSGIAAVERRDDGDGPVRRLATAGPGAVLGEVGMLLRRPRMATVRAVTDLEVVEGGVDAFEALLAVPGVALRLRELATTRLAQDVRPVRAHLPDGTAVVLRPMLPSDRAALVAATRSASAETLRRRFFTTGLPSDEVIDHLVHIDYVDHFAWVVLDGRDRRRSLAVGRSIRHAHGDDTAEVAFAVRDTVQCRGIGTLLLGAVGASASLCGIARFVAPFLSDNVRMRAVFAKAGARFHAGEPGVVEAEVDVARAAALLDDELRRALQDAVRDLVTCGP